MCIRRDVSIALYILNLAILKEINKACSLKGLSRNNMFCFYRSRRTGGTKQNTSKRKGKRNRRFGIFNCAVWSFVTYLTFRLYLAYLTSNFKICTLLSGLCVGLNIWKVSMQGYLQLNSCTFSNVFSCHIFASCKLRLRYSSGWLLVW